MKLFLRVCLVFLGIFCGEGAKILGVFHFPAYSHYQLGAKLLTTLAERGHEVTVISPYAEKTQRKNYREIILTDSFEGVDGKYISIYYNI